MKMKKSYNPFKMWGSYVGLVLGGIGTYIAFAVDSSWLSAIIPNTDGMQLILPALSLPIIGFLLGWGIHSLVRYFRK